MSSTCRLSLVSYGPEPAQALSTCVSAAAIDA